MKLKKAMALIMIGAMIMSFTAITSSAATIPSGGISGLEPGKFYSTTGSACTCHSWCSWSNPGTCIVFNNAIQCAGFARKAYNYVTGKTLSAQTPTTKNVSITSGSVAQTQLQGLTHGTYVYMQTSTGYGHYFVIYSTSSTNITIYHANYSGGACAIGMDTYTWANFATRFTYLYNYVQA